MHLTPAQRTILLAIEADPALTSHFQVLCATLEAALGAVLDDPERTNPFGIAAIVDERPEPVEVDEAAIVIALAWIDVIADAIEAEGGTLSGVSFDRDGIPTFVDARPLFAVAKACGFTEGQLRIVLTRARKDERTAPRRAMKILAALGKLRPAKRKEHFRDRARVVRLKDCFARLLDDGEIARAKAGSIIYSLVARPGGYVAMRTRRTGSRPTVDADGDALDVISVGNVDVMDGFSVPLFPCDELHATALAQFVQFLDEVREDKPRYTYQRLVHRAPAA